MDIFPECLPLDNPDLPEVYRHQEFVQEMTNDEQKQELIEIANNFLDEVKKSGLKPDDPNYKAIWKRAAQKADSQVRILFGNQFLN